MFRPVFPAPAPAGRPGRDAEFDGVLPEAHGLPARDPWAVAGLLPPVRAGGRKSPARYGAAENAAAPRPWLPRPIDMSAGRGS
ncbi:hypothetical protein SHIRM173S_03170 [Streptomyces hirsutus]